TIAGDGNASFFGDGGPAIAAELQYPVGLAFDSQGRLYIGDTLNERIRRIALDGTIATVAGTGTLGFGGDGGAATSADLANPFGLAVDSSGRIYIADTFHQRIRRVELDGTITTVAGTGILGFSGDGGPATRAQIANPNAVSLDSAGRLY